MPALLWILDCPPLVLSIHSSMVVRANCTRWRAITVPTCTGIAGRRNRAPSLVREYIVPAQCNSPFSYPAWPQPRRSRIRPSAASAAPNSQTVPGSGAAPMSGWLTDALNGRVTSSFATQPL